MYEDYIINSLPSKSQEIIFKEQKYACNDYAPLPVVITKGNGVFLQDVENNFFIDFLAGYSALNHGHNNTKILKDAFDQANHLYMISRAFYSDKLCEASELISKIFDYEKSILMNSGVEAGETAIKICRRWGYKKKNIPNDQAKVIFAHGNFWGRTIYACATSDDPLRYEGFGPFEKDSHYLIPYNDTEELEKVLKRDPTICAFYVEPIQGEGGVRIPDKGYLKKVGDLCKKYNVLFVADEIQTGCGRAGHLYYCQSDNVKPDLLCLGKSLSGGLYPVSAVLCSKEIMDLIRPGEHGSTYGGNPLASTILISAMNDLLERDLIKNCSEKGKMLGERFLELKNSKILKEIRGRGLMFGLELHDDLDFNAYNVSIWLMERGILCRPARKGIIR